MKIRSIAKICTLILVCFFSFTWKMSKGFANEQISEANDDSTVAAEETNFREMITHYKRDTFEGIGQNILYPNLAQTLTLKYTISKLDETLPISFNFSSFKYGNSNSDGSFPLEGRIYFEITDKSGHLIEFFESESLHKVTLGPKKLKMYIIETDTSFGKRRSRAKDLKITPLPEFPFIAVANWDYYNTDITFYQRYKNNPAILIENGVFKGKQR